MADEVLVNLKDFDALPTALVDSDVFHASRGGHDYKALGSEMLKAADLKTSLSDALATKPAASSLTNSLYQTDIWLSRKSGLVWSFDSIWTITRSAFTCSVTIPAGWVVDTNSATQIEFSAQTIDDCLNGGGITAELTENTVEFTFVDNIATIVEGNDLDVFVIAKNVKGIIRSSFPTINSVLYPSATTVLQLSWLFDTLTTDSAPADGYFRMNSATPASVTYLYMAKKSYQGIDVSTILNGIVSGEAIQILQNSDITRYIIAVAGTVEDATGYVKIPVTISTSGSIFQSAYECATTLFYQGTGGGYLSAVTVDGVTVTGNGTSGSPLVASDTELLRLFAFEKMANRMLFKYNDLLDVSISGTDITVIFPAGTITLPDIQAYSVSTATLTNIPDGGGIRLIYTIATHVFSYSTIASLTAYTEGATPPAGTYEFIIARNIGGKLETHSPSLRAYIYGLA